MPRMRAARVGLAPASRSRPGWRHRRDRARARSPPTACETTSPSGTGPGSSCDVHLADARERRCRAPASRRGARLACSSQRLGLQLVHRRPELRSKLGGDAAGEAREHGDAIGHVGARERRRERRRRDGLFGRRERARPARARTASPCLRASSSSFSRALRSARSESAGRLTISMPPSSSRLPP